MRLDRSQLEVLWGDYFKHRCLKERDIIIVEYLYLVKYVVNRMLYSEYLKFYCKDMYSSGVIGLVKAVEDFQLARGIKFESYAIMRIRGAIIDDLRKMSWAPRSVYKDYKEICAAQEELENKLDRQASDEELAEHMHITVEALSKKIINMEPVVVLSLNSDLLSSEKVDNNTLDSSQILAKKDIENALEEYIKSLPDKDRNVLIYHYYHGLSGRNIAEIMGLSESRISQIHSRALMRLKRKFCIDFTI